MDDRNYEVVRAFRLFFRQPDDPRQGSRSLHNRHAAVPPEGVLALQRHDEGQVLVHDAWKGMRGIEPDGGQDRLQLEVVEVAQPGLLSGVPLAPLQESDPFPVEQREQDVVQDAVLLVHQLVGNQRDAPKLLGGRQVVGPRWVAPTSSCCLSPETRISKNSSRIDPAMHRKAQPFQERHILALGLFEHPPIELKLRQLAIDVEVRAREVHGLLRGRRSRHTMFRVTDRTREPTTAGEAVPAAPRPGRDRLFDAPRDLVDFTFDESVVDVFPDMIRRSVPGYDTVVGMTGLIAARHLRHGWTLLRPRMFPRRLHPLRAARRGRCTVRDRGGRRLPGR